MNKDRFDEFSLLLASSSKSMQRLKVMGMLPLGLTGAHTTCLRHLCNNPDGLTRTKIVRLCGIDKAQVSRVINDLCVKGYVIETENESLNYRKRLKLTPLGIDATKAMNELILDLSSFVNDAVPPEDLEVFYRTFALITEKLKEAEDILEKKITDK